MTERSGRIQALQRWAIRFAVVTVLLAAGTEFALRIYVHHFRSPAERWDHEHRTFVLRPGEYPRDPEPMRVNSRGFVGAEFTDPKPVGVRRVVVLGDSCTVGAGTSTGHYPAMLEQLLNGASTESRVQVINAGLDGLTTGLALGRLRGAVLPLEPDTVVFYLGWNDLMKHNPEGQGAKPGLAIVWRYLDPLWSVRGARKLVYYHLRWRSGSPPRTGERSRTGRFRDYRPVVFERNLETMIRDTRTAGSGVVLVTLPTAVHDALAVRDVRSGYVQFPYFGGGDAVGDFVDLIDAYNRSIKRLALTEQVELLDLSGEVAGRADRADLFLDAMHLTQDGHRAIAGSLAEVLRRGGR